MTSLALPLHKLNALNVYGPRIWYVIHLFALGYLKREKLLYHPYQAFIVAIKELFPCQICKNHFEINMIKLPIEHYLANPMAIFMWTYLVHNEVNELNHKTSPSYNVCLKYTKNQLKSWEILPNLFFTLFTLVKYNNMTEKRGYLIMLTTSLKYLIPIDEIREVYIYSLEKYQKIESVTVLYWIYLIYKEVYELLNLQYYSYSVILEYFQQ